MGVSFMDFNIKLNKVQKNSFIYRVNFRELARMIRVEILKLNSFDKPFTILYRGMLIGFDIEDDFDHGKFICNINSVSM